jgi:3-oxoacyl-[acyl-carrier-protein] synthase II
MEKKKRVVITGMGSVSPAGVGVDSFWNTMIAGKSCIKKITRFDTSEGYKCKVAAEVKDFDPTDHIDRKTLKKTDRSTQYALVAAREALKSAGIKIENINSWRSGISMGIAVGGMDFTEQQIKNYVKKGIKGISPYSAIAIFCCASLGQISIELGIFGPSQTFSTGCTAGTDAIGHALRTIQKGDVDFMIAGGTDAPITPLTIYSFDVIHCLSRGNNNTPEKASRPFDKERNGFVMGEGCGVVVLEELEHALKRGAHIYAEVSGFGSTCNAYHMTAPAPEGIQAAQAIRNAISDAGKKPKDINYINAHGTSTPLNGKAETLAIKNVFGDYSYQIPISSIKSMIGHPLGGSGGMQTIATSLTIDKGHIPPTINYETPDPECDLDYVPNRSRKRIVDTAIIDSFGFAGKNSSLVLEKYQEKKEVAA